MAFYRPVAEARLVPVLATLGIAPPVWAPRKGSTTTVSPIKSNRRGMAFQLYE